MHQFHIPQCSIQNRDELISLLVGALWIWNRCIVGFVNWSIISTRDRHPHNTFKSVECGVSLASSELLSYSYTLIWHAFIYKIIDIDPVRHNHIHIIWISARAVHVYIYVYRYTLNQDIHHHSSKHNILNTKWFKRAICTSKFRLLILRDYDWLCNRNCNSYICKIPKF